MDSVGHQISPKLLQEFILQATSNNLCHDKL